MPRRAEAVYAYIATHEGVTDDELVEVLHLPSRAAVAAVCRRLEEAGRIERRKEGRIVRNLVARPRSNGDAEATSVPVRTITIPDHRAIDAGVLVKLHRAILPKRLAKPGLFSFRVDVVPDDARDAPGTFAASMGFDGSDVLLHLRAKAAEPRAGTVREIARALSRIGGRPPVRLTVRWSEARTDPETVVPALPAQEHGPVNRTIAAGKAATVRWWLLDA